MEIELYFDDEEGGCYFDVVDTVKVEHGFEKGAILMMAVKGIFVKINHLNYLITLLQKAEN